MKVYLVGGAVRDTLLGRPIKDKDFVVVGATPNDLINQGFTQVGMDFPVFLHPHTHAEYALARTERKNGKGHQGFSVETCGVSLEDDLSRRDLTINALAMPVFGLFDDTPTGKIIDPYNGQFDLQNKCLRHVSSAFIEDPLRVLRVARFYARFYELGFTIAPDTITLMKSIADCGELSCLSRERIWAECTKAFDEKNSFAFFEILFKLDILKHLLPELNTVWQNEDIRQNTFNFLQKADGRPHHILFSLLVSGFLEDEDGLQKICERLLTPKSTTKFTLLLSKHYKDLTNLAHLSSHEFLCLIESTKAQKDPHVLFELMDTVEIMTDQPLVRQYVKDAITLYQSVNIKDVDDSFRGRQIGVEMTRLRLQKLNDFFNT